MVVSGTTSLARDPVFVLLQAASTGQLTAALACLATTTHNNNNDDVNVVVC